MDMHEVMGKVEALLEKAKTGVLATTDDTGQARLRWMTPTLLPGRAGTIYAVTTPDSHKVQDLTVNPNVEWMIQSPHLGEIVNLRGIAHAIDNPALRTEIVETIGRKLTTFWKVNPAHTEFVVLETVIIEARYFQPMKEIRESVRFRKEASE
jgi:general stress protein 26